MSLICGVGCEIHKSANISKNADVILGDYVYIGPNVKISDGIVRIGDYSKIHDNVYINPKLHVTLGHLSWIGQGTILDGTGGIIAGNYLGVGINSALYSHIRHGDILQGCKYNMNKELIIGDDVWFVGMCLVSPIKAENKSMAMLGSVITKNMELNHVYGGNPAKDLTEKIGVPWNDISIDKKMADMTSNMLEYYREDPSFDIDSIHIVEEYPEKMDDRTFYNITDRTYTKKHSLNEVKFNKWLFKYKAKFIPNK